MPALAFAAPLNADAKNWVYVGGNSWAQNYSPQTQLSTANVNDLEVKWIFPLQGATTAPAGMQALATNTGSTTPPIVADGKVFVTTNFLRTYAIDAKTGKQLWSHDYVIDIEDVESRLPVWYAGAPMGIIAAHLHGIRYWESGNALLLTGRACDMYGIDADTGETSFMVEDLCLDIPGNMYLMQQGAASQTNIGTYEAERLFVYVLPGAMHSSVFEGDFRHTTLGIDMDTKEIVWRLYSFPPHGVLSKDWALQECDIGFFRDIPCSTVAAQAPENLEWDWAQPDEAPSIYGGVTSNWGQIIIDEDTGIIYTQTGNQGPFTYIGETPGPRLYGSTIMAIDASSGQRLWWNQPMPRDPYDYDCNWSGILAEDPTYGKVYMKGCKEGLLQILDAETGEPIHSIDVIEDQVNLGQVSDAALKEYPEGGIRFRTMDPLNNYDMRVMTAPDGSSYCGDPCNVYPYWMNGIFATDMSYDPTTNILYHYAGALQVNGLQSGEGAIASGSFSVGGAQSPTTNVTIMARDVTTGEIKWSYYYDLSMQRAHMVVSDSLLWTGFPDGMLRFFNKDTGELLREMNMGSALQVGTTTAQDSDGNQKLFILTGEGSSAINGIMPATPGTVIAIGLSERAQSASIMTVTSTATSTSSTTVTATSTSISTSISSTTATITSSVTEEVGMSSTITYAAVAVAVIAIIGAALLYTKKITI
ncbi:PQQ-binding-like beta-propeller repeat protein [Thermoproteota archaeon]